MALTSAQLVARVERCGPYLYHATDAERLQSVLREGLHASGSHERTHEARLLRPGCVYLGDWDTVRWQAADAEWGDLILAVDLRRLEPARFVADEENYRGLDSTGQPESDWTRWPAQDAATLLALFPQMDEPEVLGQTLGYELLTIAYQGRVAPAALGLAQLPQRPDLPELGALAARLPDCQPMAIPQSGD